jgi:hypothetical protein
MWDASPAPQIGQTVDQPEKKTASKRVDETRVTALWEKAVAGAPHHYATIKAEQLEMEPLANLVIRPARSGSPARTEQGPITNFWK